MSYKRIISILCILVFSAQMLSAQSAFDSRYSTAESQYARKQYQAAITSLKNAKKAMGVTNEQIAKADALIARCENAIRIQNQLVLDVHDVKASYEGGLDTIHVVAGQAWKATIDGNDWCAAQSMGSDLLILNIRPNKTKELRLAQVQVKMGKQTDIVYVRQEPRPDTHRMVRIGTDPEYAQIWIEGQDRKYDSPWAFDLPAGRHTIKIEKDGYASKDTTIFIEDDLSTDAINLNFRLARNFGRIRFKVDPEPGFRFSSAPVIELNHQPISMSGRRYRYDSAEPIQYYKIYEDETIPVYPTHYSVTVHADKFKTFDKDYGIYKDMDTLIHVVLQARTGLLSVSDMENARGAEVLLDNESIGTVPLSKFRTGIGNHELIIRKDGYLPEFERYPLNILEHMDTTVHVSMARFGKYRFTSSPSGAQVYVDDKPIGETPVDYLLKAGDHKVSVSRKGYSTVTEVIYPEFGDDLYEQHFSLMQTYPLTVSCDIDSLLVVIKQKNEIFAQDVKTPVTVRLPFSKKPYRLELYRVSQPKPVYWGPLSFREEGKTEHRVLTYSRSNLQWMGADFLLGAPVSDSYPYRKFGDFRLLNFKIVRGLSTSFLKASLFRNPEGIPEVNNSRFVPAFSCVFLNYEFRIGGRILENLDICALGEAAWYPHFLSELRLPMTFMSGMEWFAGLELTSRIPTLNGHIKAGYQRFLDQDSIAPALWMAREEENDLTKAPLSFPGAFVVSIGFSLGNQDSKGENMIRLF